MSSVTVQLDEDIVALLHSADQPIEHTAIEFIVLELYRRGKVSSGKAAQLLEMSRFEFIRHASRLGIAFFDSTEDEWAAERTLAETL